MSDTSRMKKPVKIGLVAAGLSAAILAALWALLHPGTGNAVNSQAVFVTKLKAPQPIAGEWFGYSVSSSNGTILVGTSGPPESSQGAAYIFSRASGTWVYQQTLLPSDCYNCHGSSKGRYTAALSGDTAVVGNAFRNIFINGQLRSQNAAFIFTRSSGTWSEKQTVIGPVNPTNIATHAFPVSMYGSTFVMGTSFNYPRADVVVKETSGGCTPSTTWIPQLLMPTGLPTNPGNYEWYGHSVAVGSEGAAVSEVHGNKNQVHVFQRISGDWKDQQQIELPGPVQPVGSPFPIAMSGDTMAVGASWMTGTGQHEGAVFVYIKSGGTWTLQQTLKASDAAAEERFGYSVAIDDDRIVAGAAAETDAGERAAYLFSRKGTTWTEQQKILVPVGGADPSDPFPVSISGDVLVIGASGDDAGAEDSGAAFVYILKPSANLSVQKAGNGTPVQLSTATTFTVTVTNNDPDNQATNVIVSDQLPASLTYVSAGGAGACSTTASKVTCTIGSIDAGASKQVYMTVRTTATGTIANTATVSADQPDPVQGNNTGTANIVVINSPPVADSQILPAMNEDSPGVPITLTGSDAVTAAADLEFTIVDAPAHGTLSGAPPQVMYTPNSNYYGTDSFTFTVTNERGFDSPKATVSLTINPVNDPPVLVTTLTSTTVCMDSHITIPLTVSDIETVLNDPGYIKVAPFSDLVPPGGIQLQYAGPDPNDPTKFLWTMTLTPAAGRTGSVKIDVTVYDGPQGALSTLSSTTQRFTLYVNSCP